MPGTRGFVVAEPGLGDELEGWTSFARAHQGPQRGCGSDRKLFSQQSTS